MLTAAEFIVLTLFAAVALLYSMAGQAGGTGYVAVMGLLGFSPDVIKPTALALNILVATIACARFYRARLLTWRTCYPFGILGVPFSLLGGSVHLPSGIYQPVVGIILLAAAIQMLRSARAAELHDSEAPRDPPFPPSLMAGAAIGFVSGITGVGGGIFLAPLILTMHWAATRQTAAISATFNLLNSAAALAGAWTTTGAMPLQLAWWLPAVAVGGLLGSWIAAYRLKPETLRYILAALLGAAALRMITSMLG